MNSLAQRVAATIDRYGLFTPGQRVGVAVSGGADSVCLLHVLLELGSRWGLRLTVLHLDHQLRGAESREDAEFVAGLAAAFGLPAVVRRTELGGGNLEAAGRRARLAFFEETIRSGAVDRVATGHTRSDQAETVLFRLLRGSGTAGMAAIRPRTGSGLARPLIEVVRAEVESYLRDRSIAWREDSTNRSLRFARNRIRHELMPQLAREWNPEIAAVLARMADNALAEEDWWRAETDRLEAGHLRRYGGAILLPASGLRSLPIAAARRLVRRAMERELGHVHGIDFDHVDAVVRLAGRPSGDGMAEAHGLEICRSFDWLRFAQPSNVVMDTGYRLTVHPPGVARAPGTGPALCLELVENSGTSTPLETVYNEAMGLDWERLSGSLELRNWAPGDRYRPFGSAVDKKLKTLFHVARIPVWERRQWPVLVNGKAIVWTRRFGACAEFASGPETRTILRIREMEAE